jgi:hypothetical protein
MRASTSHCVLECVDHHLGALDVVDAIPDDRRCGPVVRSLRAGSASVPGAPVLGRQEILVRRSRQ